MAVKKSKKCPANQTRLPLHSLFSSFHSPQGFTTDNLKRLYGALLYLSSSKSSDCFDSKLKCEEISGLTHVLFCELESRFNGLFCAMDAVIDSRDDDLSPDFGVRIEEVTLLLRCCLCVLILVGWDQNLFMEKCSILRAIIGRLITFELSGGGENGSVVLKRVFFREHECVGNDSSVKDTEEFVAIMHLMEQSNPWCAPVCALLEVIADELLAHLSSGEYCMLDYSAASATEILFTNQTRLGNIGSVLQVITAHFILSVSDEKGFRNIFHRLFWCYEENHRIPEMSLPSALLFLANPVVSSTPKTFQAYFILMVSEVIGIFQPSEEKINLRFVDYYLQAFEKSVILYGRHMSCLHVNNSSGGDDSFGKSDLLGRSGLPTYETFLQDLSRDKLHFLISRINNSLDLYSSGMFSRTDSDTVAASIFYVKENIHVFDESYRDEIFSFMSMIIMMTRCSSNDSGATKLQRDGEISAQNLCLLASTLKLMSCSLLQATCCIRRLKSSSCLPAKDTYACKLYDAIVNIINPFEHFSVHLPIQKLLSGIVQSLSGRHMESEGMLLHFLGLLSLSYASGLDFLVKDCLFLLMALLNFFIIEEGGISALNSLLALRTESSFPESLHNIKRSLVVHKRIQISSSKTRRIQEKYSRTRSQVYSQKRIQDYDAEILEYASFQDGMDAGSNLQGFSETCNGEVYLKCVLGTQSRTDIDDLADFIVCKEGKDYHGWLRGRERFREWKCKKTKTLRWERKKKHWSRLRK